MTNKSKKTNINPFAPSVVGGHGARYLAPSTGIGLWFHRRRFLLVLVGAQGPICFLYLGWLAQAYALKERGFFGLGFSWLNKGLLRSSYVE
jgi:hypothetical protein